MKTLKILLISTGIVSLLNANMQNDMMNKQLNLTMVNEMKPGMQMKLKYDYLVNLPILMRAVFKNKDNPTLNLSKKQKIEIINHKTNVMDAIMPIMKKSHKLSKQLKDGLLNDKLSQKQLVELSNKIADLKKQVLNMKITCIQFIKKTLTKEQFQILISIDKKMPYLNYPYNY